MNPIAILRPRCPECGANKRVPISYGYPTPVAQEKAAAGKLVLGGCVLHGDDPRWACPHCGHRWR